MAKTSNATTTKTRNRVYGVLESQFGTLVLDSDFVRDQIATTIEHSPDDKDKLFEGFRTMFENPKIVWLNSKEEYLKFAEETWNSLYAESK